MGDRQRSAPPALESRFLIAWPIWYFFFLTDSAPFSPCALLPAMTVQIRMLCPGEVQTNQAQGNPEKAPPRWR